MQADAVLALFHRCYAPRVVGLGGLLWERIALPHEGSVSAQQAWLMAALDYLADVHNGMAIDAAARRQTKTTETPAKKSTRGQR